MIERYIKITFMIIAVLVLLYVLKVPEVIAAFDWLIDVWNDLTIYITTFKDRHPIIMLFMPVIIIVLLFTARDE